MMATRALLILFSTLLFTSSSLTTENNEISSTTPEALSAITDQDRKDNIARAVNEFGYKLILDMTKKDVDRNIVISPTGIAGLLAMTLLGTVGNTYNELATTLGFSQDILENRKYHEQFGQLLHELNANLEAGDNELSAEENTTTNGTTDEPATEADMNSRTLYANAILVDEKIQIRNIYRQYLSNVYHGDAISLNISDKTETRQKVNDWVKNHTEWKIEEFLQDPLPANTKAVLLSALYFSGQWARPFLPEFTRPMAFQSPKGPIVADLMLNLGDFKYTYKAQHGVHMIAIPYNHSETVMYILKPMNKKPILEVLKSLDYQTIDSLIQSMTEQQCVLRFPKMDLKTKTDLRSSLQGLGLKSVFTPGDANFALMVDPSNYKKDPISHEKEDELLTRIYEGEPKEPKKLVDVVNGLPNPDIHVDSVLHDVKMTINEYGTVAVAATSGILSRTARLFYADSPFYMFIRNERTKLVTFGAVIFDPTDSG